MANEGVKIEILGSELIEKRFKKLITSNRNATATAMNLSAADLLQRSADIAPILTGDLIRSGRVAKTGSNAKTIIRIIGYGTNHAVFAHESITPAGPFNLGPVSSRKPSTSDGRVGGKFLLRPYLNHKRRYIELISSSIQDAFVEVLD